MFNRSDFLTKNDGHQPKRNMAQRILYCFILGNALSDVFPVTIGEVTRVNGADIPFKDFTIGYLKDYIIEKKNLASILNIWKVGIIEGSEEWNILEGKPNTEIDIEQELKGNKLDSSMEPIAVSFPESRPKGIVIIVQPPQPATTGKRKAEDLNEDRAKRGKLQQDKEKIQYFINSLQNIKTSDKKLIVPALPRKSGATTIFNRGCYGYLSKFILDDIDNNTLDRYCVTGNPGVGKSYFGILMLVELIKRNKSVLIDYEGFTACIYPNGELLEVENHDHTLYGQIAEEENVWCIIDSVMPKFNHDLVGKFIMVSSPKKEFIERFTKAPRSETFYMPPWEIDELNECQSIIYTQIAQDSIKEKFNLCGGVARWIFDTAMTLDKIKLRIEGALSLIDLKSLLRAQGEHFSGDGFSHKLIHIKTNEDTTENPYTKAICTFASNFVENKCLGKFHTDHIDDLRTFIENSKNIAEMSVLRGKMFEMWSHAKICKGGIFQVRQLQENSNEETVTFENLTKVDFSDIKDVNIRPGIYYQPVAKNYQSIDSYIHPNILFQITIADRHGVKQEKLKEYKDKNILNQGDEIRLYFIVPEESFRSYKKQNYLDGSKKAENVPKWIQNIKQYALCMKCDKY